MGINRRTILGSTVTIGALSLTGCLNDEQETNHDDEETDQEDDIDNQEEDHNSENIEGLEVDWEPVPDEEREELIIEHTGGDTIPAGVSVSMIFAGQLVEETALEDDVGVGDEIMRLPPLEPQFEDILEEIDPDEVDDVEVDESGFIHYNIQFKVHDSGNDITTEIHSEENSTSWTQVPEITFETEFGDNDVDVTITDGDTLRMDEIEVSTGTLNPDQGEKTAGDTFSIVGVDGDSVDLLWTKYDTDVVLDTLEAPPPPEVAVEEWMQNENLDWDGAIEDRTGEAEVTIANGDNLPDYKFNPRAAIVDVGTTVVFEWTSNGHTVHVEDSTTDFEEMTDIEDEGFSYQMTLNEEGFALYYCQPHRGQGHVGGLIVE